MCKAPWPVSAKLTFDCDKCDCIEYLPARLALSLITETDFDELSRSADKICNPRARGGGRLMKQYLDFTSKLELIPCIDVVCLIKTNTENCMNVKTTLDRICLQQSGSRGCATMQRSPAVSQKLIQWQACVLKEVSGLAVAQMEPPSSSETVRQSPASARHAIDETHQSSELPGDGQQQRSPSPAAAHSILHLLLLLLLLLLIIASVRSKSSLFPSE